MNHNKSKTFAYILLSIVILLTSSAVNSAMLKGRVFNVSTGHTIVIKTNDGAFKTVRLAGLSNPPNDLRKSTAARNHLAMLVAGKPIKVEYSRLTPEGIILGLVQHGGSDINLRMITDGMAGLDFSHEIDPVRAASYRSALSFAQNNHLGFWK